MTAGIYDVTIEQGADFSKTLTIKNPDGTVVNFTGWAVRSQIRKKPRDVEIVAAFTTTFNGPATDGKINWSLTAVASDDIDNSRAVNFDPLEYFYDMEIISPGGIVTRILQGSCLIVPNVTRTEGA